MRKIIINTAAKRPTKLLVMNATEGPKACNRKLPPQKLEIELWKFIGYSIATIFRPYYFLNRFMDIIGIKIN